MSNILTNNINPRSGNKITIGGVNDTVSIAGTITYEDVTSVDSVGVITARSGVEVTSGTVQVGGDPNDGTAAGTKMTTSGVIQSTRASGSAASAVFMGFLEGDTSANFRVNANGSGYLMGDVGIGTDNPNHKLTLHQSGTGTFDAINFATGNTNSTGYQMGVNSSGEVFHWNTTNSSINFATNNTEKLRIDSSGRLLIGGSSARTSGIGTQANLYVTSPAVTGTASTVYVAKFQGNSSVADSQALISCSAGYPITANDSEGHVHFGARREGSGNQGAFIVKTGTTQTERLRVNSNGYVKAADDLNDADFLNLNSTYHAFANGRNGNIVFLTEHYGTNNPSSYYAYFSQASPDNNTAYFLTCQDSTTTRVRIWSDGDLDNHDNSYGAISDVKLKQDIVDAGSQWDDLKNLRVRKFKFKTDVNAYGDQAKTLIGLIAQEAETVCPGLVKETDDVGNDGLPNGETTKAIRYSVLYMKAIKALQEAQTRIETLEARVAALEGN